MKPTPLKIDRRKFLRGAGATIALPFWESVGSPLLSAAQSRHAATPISRMVCVGMNFGIFPDTFFPETTGPDFETTDYLSHLEAFRNQYSVFSNLDHGSVVAGHAGCHALLSGVESKHAKSHPGGNVTMDQIAAEHIGNATRFPSVQYDIGGEKSIHSWSRLSWTRNGIAIPPVFSLQKIFDTLFLETSESQKRRLARSHQLNSSILDVVLDAANDYKKRLNPSDLSKLDEYFTSIREIELRLTKSAEWMEKAKPFTDYKLPEPLPYTFVEKVPLYYDLIRLTLMTDSSRVVTFGVTDWDGPVGIEGITQGYHTITHHGREKARLAQLKVLEGFLFKSFGKFLSDLKETRVENDTSLLDSTMVLLGSGMGNASNHSNRNLPLLLAGGGLRHGQHRSYSKFNDNKTPACNLLLSMLHRFGVERDQFGDSDGSLSELI
ncbi:MAG: DUF1552 domain-containing protein [Synoicihabitans sp.]